MRRTSSLNMFFPSSSSLVYSLARNCSRVASIITAADSDDIAMNLVMEMLEWEVDGVDVAKW